MTTNKNIREQRPAKTDVEKLFVIAVNELMQIWDNNSEHNVEKMNSIVRSLRAKKLFPKRAYDKLESFFRPDGRFFAMHHCNNTNPDMFLVIFCVHFEHPTQAIILKPFYPY